MIHNIKVSNNIITCEIRTEIGRCDCSIELDNLTDGGQPKLFATNYIIHNEAYNKGNAMHVLCLSKMATSIYEVCDNNNWCAWSY